MLSEVLPQKTQDLVFYWTFPFPPTLCSRNTWEKLKWRPVFGNTSRELIRALQEGLRQHHKSTSMFRRHTCLPSQQVRRHPHRHLLAHTLHTSAHAVSSAEMPRWPLASLLILYVVRAYLSFTLSKTCSAEETWANPPPGLPFTFQSSLFLTFPQYIIIVFFCRSLHTGLSEISKGFFLWVFYECRLADGRVLTNND